RVPPGQPLTERSGRFIEVRGANRQVLYRRAITELLPENIEYRTGNPEQPLGRTPAPRRGEISLLVPDLADGRSAALVVTTRTGPDGERPRTGASQDIARSTRSRDLITIDLPRNGGDQ